jgi:hypothetical protein
MGYFFNTSDVNQTFIIEPLATSGDTTPIISACTAVYTNRLISCDDNGTTIFLSDKVEVSRSIVPLIDAMNDLGIPSLRFRNINTVSGTSSVWTSTQKVITPEIDLGLDSQGNHRIITADSSIVQNDDINGGYY